ncbi:hypothetical protein PENANT_c006G02308 [Penicillium antarcticum]|uniref:Cytochrome b5 heme-binding domain-containing protein n=1 Tax=Penicillium antarcticum TaxID=416450 RepID=A0A1V6QD14_9EURO|nr:uncharacterized protein N7508_009317 [Penicillium antarcticum]KAJ5294496.1 hypothetical protein N7508_009317 [Penicillium antarcticum]OQD87104.1 hypothetical protein PENANT_c006G02308 [Penicillium antarcticum]
MGWVGAGVLVATTVYFLYRYPPRSWNEPRPLPPPELKPEAAVTTPISDESVREKHGPRPSTPTIETEQEDSQSTPKASASSAPPPPVFTVPTLNLDSGENETSNPTMPSIPQFLRGGQSTASGRDNAAPKPQSSQPPLAPPRQPSTTGGSLMPPPPPPVPKPRPAQKNSLAPPTLQPPRLSGSSLGPPPSAASSQRGPPTSSSRLSSSTLAPTPVTLKKSNSKKVILEPGFSPLDWAALTSNPNNNLRGKDVPPGLLRVTPSMLKEQHGRKGRDAWTSYHGKVYNISPYAPYHPGGKGELLRGAGKDSARLFQEIHPWVNWEGILGECLIGILVSESDLHVENALDAMD